MQEYFHSVRLNTEKCKGCVNCIKRCPTEAIRIRGGKAQIIESRCIDCGECIRRCPSHAKTAFTDTLNDLANYKWNIALPAPALYSQFNHEVSIEQILEGLLILGFDEIFEVALAAEYVSAEIHDYLSKNITSRPFISSACPAVVRLIQVKFPELIDYIIPVDSPVALAGKIAKCQSSVRLGIPPEQIGVWFITPCPAKVTAVKQPVDLEISYISGAIGISEIYGELLKAIGQNAGNVKRTATQKGVGWALAGGETKATEQNSALTIHGIQNVNEVLEQVVLGKLNDIDYLECLACAGGCIGGPLTVQNRFIAEKNMKKRLEIIIDQDVDRSSDYQINYDLAEYALNKKKIEPRSILRLDSDIVKALQKMEQIEETLARLPGLDCGSCGSPSCKALAEDIVQGHASETDCVFKLRERVKTLAEEMVDLAQRLPPSLNKDTK